MAVGGSDTVGTVAERWNGRRWLLESTPRELGASTLTAVSCVSPRVCMAVGYVSTNASDFTALAERWNGRRWKLERTSQAGLLEGVSCVSERFCVAVGSYAGGAPTLAQRWNGRRWAVQSTPNPHTVSAYKSPAQSYLLGVSCSSTRACIAVGSYTPAQYTHAPLVERWNGRKWSIRATAKAANFGFLSGVSCAAASACTAVGLLGRRDEHDIERWNGRKWIIQKGATTWDGTLQAVSCAARTSCTAVGSKLARNSDRHLTLAERWRR